MLERGLLHLHTIDDNATEPKSEVTHWPCVTDSVVNLMT